MMLLLFVFILGCRGNSQSSVSGKLSFNSQPIQDGSIRFFPVDGTEGHGAVAKIEKGRYDIPLKSGLSSGTYVVRITAVRKTGRMIQPREVMPGDDGKPTEEEIQFIPSKYNSKTQLRVDLKPGSNTFDQDLSASPANST
ncbi:MAG: hypothetical protein L0228_01745 [Planctomycetes bacterium]|nr:hypothetical protein [Planctomycetota bacterium]